MLWPPKTRMKVVLEVFTEIIRILPAELTRSKHTGYFSSVDLKFWDRRERRETTTFGPSLELTRSISGKLGFQQKFISKVDSVINRGNTLRHTSLCTTSIAVGRLDRWGTRSSWKGIKSQKPPTANNTDFNSQTWVYPMLLAPWMPMQDLVKIVALSTLKAGFQWVGVWKKNPFFFGAGGGAPPYFFFFFFFGGPQKKWWVRIGLEIEFQKISKLPWWSTASTGQNEYVTGPRTQTPSANRGQANARAMQLDLY